MKELLLTLIFAINFIIFSLAASKIENIFGLYVLGIGIINGFLAFVFVLQIKFAKRGKGE